ncbi:MAG TPA: ligase-associated DNA damage response exonuclease [Ignavibacteria bacterium]|jgi:putative mRNA 3-end processing factor
MLTKNNLLDITSKGLYSPQADLYIDPWANSGKAIITHAHSDHARFGQKLYFAHHLTVPILKYRLGDTINTKAVEYGNEFMVNGVKISLHPAGHVPGSAQVRLELNGEVAVVSGDYKTENDKLAAPFEPIKCNVFVTESTFGLPIYKWQSQKSLFKDINNWWRQNKERGKVSVLAGYPLGKAQRMLYNVDSSIGNIYAHGAVQYINDVFKKSGLRLPASTKVTNEISKKDLAGSLVLAPPSAIGSPWLKRFEPFSLGYASGWMNVRGARRWQGMDIGFALSDHADWTGLNNVIKETGAEKIYITHGYTAVFTRWLCDIGYDAKELRTKFVGELDEKDLTPNPSSLEES